jgi:hypothetical protein
MKKRVFDRMEFFNVLRFYFVSCSSVLRDAECDDRRRALAPRVMRCGECPLKPRLWPDVFT